MTSARVGYAPPVRKRAQVQGLKESRITIREDEDRGLVSFEEVKSRHIVPNALLVIVQCVKKDIYMAVEGPSTRPIVLSMINGSYFRRRLTILEPDETKFASHLTLLSL